MEKIVFYLKLSEILLSALFPICCARLKNRVTTALLNVYFPLGKIASLLKEGHLGAR